MSPEAKCTQCFPVVHFWAKLRKLWRRKRQHKPPSSVCATMGSSPLSLPCSVYPLLPKNIPPPWHFSGVGSQDKWHPLPIGSPGGKELPFKTIRAGAGAGAGPIDSSPHPLLPPHLAIRRIPVPVEFSETRTMETQFPSRNKKDLEPEVLVQPLYPACSMAPVPWSNDRKYALEIASPLGNERDLSPRLSGQSSLPVHQATETTCLPRVPLEGDGVSTLDVPLRPGENKEPKPAQPSLPAPKAIYKKPVPVKPDGVHTLEQPLAKEKESKTPLPSLPAPARSDGLPTLETALPPTQKEEQKPGLPLPPPPLSASMTPAPLKPAGVAPMPLASAESSAPQPPTKVACSSGGTMGKAAAPPPPPSKLVAKQNRLLRVPQVSTLYRQLTAGCLEVKQEMASKKPSISMPRKVNANVLEEFTMKSAYFRNIKKEVEYHKEGLEATIVEIEGFQPTTMAQVISFVKVVDTRLGALTDEDRVLEHFSWSNRYKAMREAVAVFGQLKSIQESLAVWMRRHASVEMELLSMEGHLGAITERLDRLMRDRDQMEKRFVAAKLPWRSSLWQDAKAGALELFRVYCSLAIPEAAADEKRCAKLIKRLVEFAHRVHMLAGGFDAPCVAEFEKIQHLAAATHERA